MNTFYFWRLQGLSTRAANALCSLNCGSLFDLQAIGSEAVYTAPALGPQTYNEIARLANWPEVPIGRYKRIRPYPVQRFA